MSETRDITQTFSYSVGSSNVSVGRFTYGYEKISIKQWGEGANLYIGQFCSIASNVSIFLGGNHRSDWVSTYPFGHIFHEILGDNICLGHPSTNGNIHIGNDVWIGNGVTIMSGVRIGDGVIIAANSHVVKDAYPYEIIGGNPAKSIKLRFDKEIIDTLLQLKWWDLPLEEIKKISSLLCNRPVIENLQILISRYKENF